MDAAATPPGIGHLEDPAMLDKVTLAQAVGTSNITPRSVVTGVVHDRGELPQRRCAGDLLMAFRWWLPFVVVAAVPV